MATNSKFSADLGIKTDADLQVDGNVTVSGNLTVNGTQTTVNSTTTSVEDSMLELANANLSSDTLDIGIYGNYDDGLGDGVSEYTGFFRDASDSTWKLFDGLESEPTTTVNTSGTGYTLADLQVGDLTATTLTATNTLTGSSITYPTSDGTNGQVLTTNGSGTLSFSTISGYTDSDVETYLDNGTSTPTFTTITANNNGGNTTTIAEFQYNDGATVLGRIGNQGNDSLFIQGGTSAGAGLVFHGSVGKILPAQNGDSISDAIDLGQDTRRFKDLYMTGNLSMGGTINVNPSSSGDAVLLLQNGADTQTLRVDQNSIRTTTSNAFSIFTDGNPSQLYLNSDGNVGINENSPDFSSFGSNGGGIELDDVGSSFSAVRVSQGSTGDLYLAASTGAGYIWQSANSPLIIGTNNAERIRIQDGTGRVGINATGIAYSSSEKLSLYNDNFGFGIKTTSTPMGIWHTGTSGTLIAFASTSSGSAAGSISFSGGTATYNTTSDYRLKENVDYTWDATTRLKQLKPARFNWIADETNTVVDGFLAHEVSSIVPEAVTGNKDEIYTAEEAENAPNTSEGDIKAQQMDASKLIPLLVKTIQELEARITTLESA